MQGERENLGLEQINYIVLKYIFSGGLKKVILYRNESKRTGNCQKWCPITHDPTSHTGVPIRNWGRGHGDEKRDLYVSAEHRSLKSGFDYSGCLTVLIS